MGLFIDTSYLVALERARVNARPLELSAGGFGRQTLSTSATNTYAYAVKYAN